MNIECEYMQHLCFLSCYFYDFGGRKVYPSIRVNCTSVSSAVLLMAASTAEITGDREQGFYRKEKRGGILFTK
jgi:hypothetical protein